MEQIIFSKNWNNKLNCIAFTTIRLRNDKKYFAGAEYEVILKEGKRTTNKGKHTVIGLKHVKLKELDGFTCLMDTGMPLEDTINLIRGMYLKYSINWNYQKLTVILLKKDLNQNQPNLF